jgi:hypothetical protein
VTGMETQRTFGRSETFLLGSCKWNKLRIASSQWATRSPARILEGRHFPSLEYRTRSFSHQEQGAKCPQGTPVQKTHWKNDD